MYGKALDAAQRRRVQGELRVAASFLEAKGWRLARTLDHEWRMTSPTGWTTTGAGYHLLARAYFIRRRASA